MFEKMLPMLFSALGLTPEKGQKYLAELKELVQTISARAQNVETMATETKSQMATKSDIAELRALIETMKPGEPK